MSAVEVFTAEWSAQLAAKLNSDPPYRLAAAEWRGVLGLAMNCAADMKRMVLLDLEAGHCHRSGDDPEAIPPDFVIEGSDTTWKRVFDGKLEPMWALMSGKLRLSKGSLPALAAQGASAMRIIECARKVPSIFPSDRRSYR